MSLVELFVLANVAVLGCFCAWADTERQMALALRCGVGLLYYGLWAVALLATFVRSVLLFAGIGWLGLIFISHPVGFWRSSVSALWSRGCSRRMTTTRKRAGNTAAARKMCGGSKKSACRACANELTGERRGAGNWPQSNFSKAQSTEPGSPTSWTRRNAVSTRRATAAMTSPWPTCGGLSSRPALAGTPLGGGNASGKSRSRNSCPCRCGNATGGSGEQQRARCQHEFPFLFAVSGSRRASA